MKKLFSIFFALALLLSNVATQAQTSMPQHNLRQIQNVEVANKKSVVQGGNPIIAAKERIAQRQTQLRNNKAMQDYSLLNKVNETKLKARAMAAMAQQTETIEHNMGYTLMPWAGDYYLDSSIGSTSFVQPNKDDGNYWICFYSSKSAGTSYSNDEWVTGQKCGNSSIGSSVFTFIYSYELGEYLDVTSARAQIKNKGSYTMDFDIYYTLRDGTVYNMYITCDIGTSQSNPYGLDQEEDVSTSFTAAQVTRYVYGLRENEVYAYGLQATNNTYTLPLYIYTDPDISSTIIHSGLYNIDNTYNAYTIKASKGLVDNNLYPTYLKKTDNTKIWYFARGKAIVFNPQEEEIPKYIKIDGEGYWGSHSISVEIGTEPTKRTITVNRGNNGTEDGNNVLINHWEPVLAVNGNTYTFYQGSRFTFTPQPKEGYQFAYWAGTNTGDIIDNGDGTYSLTMGNKNYTVGAVFEPIPEPVDVTLSPNGGSGSDQVIRVTKGESMPTTLKAGGAIVVPTRAHYEFGGYYNTSASTGGTQYYSYSGSPKTLASARKYDLNTATTLHARWIPETYSITYRDQNSDITFSGTQAGAPTQHSYGTATTLKIPTRAGYTFEGWYTAKDCASGAVGTTSAASLAAEAYTANITLYAKWSQKVYYLNLTTGGNGTVSRNDNGTSETALHYGDQITLSYTPAGGYGFVNWTGTGSDYVSNNVFTVPNGTNGTTYTVQANFAPTHTMTVTADPVAGGTVTGSGTYAEGTNVTLTATPNSGYSFSRWSDGNTSNPRNVTMGNADATYTAEFLQQLYDFEYRFTWEDMVDCGQKYSSSGFNNKHYVLRTKVMKNTNSYPGLRIDMVTSQSNNKSQGYRTYNNVKLPYPASYTSTTNTVSNQNRGKVITSASNGTYVTQVYDENGTAYTLSNLTNGKVQYKEVTGQTYPFVYVKGNFNNKTVFATIGVAPTYTITLNSQRSGVNATTSGTTSVTATYTYNTYTPNPIVTPTLTGYTFGGYWTGNGGTGTQIIDADGNFIADVNGYTDALKRWFHEDNIILYTKWTAKTYTVNLDNQEATTAGTASVTATYNAAMPSATMPTKNGCRCFGSQLEHRHQSLYPVCLLDTENLHTVRND